MVSMFKSPDKPKVPPPTPTRDFAAEEAAAQIDEMRRRSKGRSSTILTDSSSLAPATPTTKSTLLGGTY